MNNQDFGKFISSLRKEKCLTQKELADKLGVTDKAVSCWENGKNYPDIEIFESLGNELGVSISELIACRKIQKTDDAELVTAKAYIDEINRTKALKNKFISLFMFLLIIVLIILFLPTSFKTYDDGGTKEIQSLTYKVVKWNKVLDFDNNIIYHKTSVYFQNDSQKQIDDLWKKEKLHLYNRSRYIEDIRCGAMNIGAEMPRILYVDDSFVVFYGTCGLIKYDYRDNVIDNRISGEYLNCLGYTTPYPIVDLDNQKIYFVDEKYLMDNSSDTAPLSFDINSNIIERETTVPKTQENNIEELNEKTRISYEQNGYLTSFDCYNFFDAYTGSDARAYLIANDDWNMATLKLVIEQNGSKTEYKVF